METLEIAEEKGLQDVLVFQICECDAVAAYWMEEAKAWYKELTGLTDDELYADDDIVTVSFDEMVWEDEQRLRKISVREIVENEWTGTPFIVYSTEF